MTHEKDERINVGAGMVPTYHATESVEEARAVVESCRPGTEDLRRMLDERGVEYVANDYKSVKETCWSYMGELDAVFAEFGDGETCFVCDTGCFTPEQAIAVTLGRGECHKVRVHEEIEDEMHCSECGRFLGFAGDIGAFPYNFCPNCGRKVVA